MPSTCVCRSRSALCARTHVQIRLELVPLLQELSGGSIKSRIDDLVRQSRLVHEMLTAVSPPETLSSLGSGGPSLDLTWWRKQPELVREDQLHRLALSTGRAVSYEKIKIACRELSSVDAVCDANNKQRTWRWQLTRNVWMVRGDNVLVIVDDSAPDQACVSLTAHDDHDHDVEEDEEHRPSPSLSSL